MNGQQGVVAVALWAPLLAAITAVVTAALLTVQRPLVFASRARKVAFVGSWLVAAPTLCVVALLLADQLAPSFWRYAGEMGLLTAGFARVAHTPLRRVVRAWYPALCFGAGVAAAAAGLLTDVHAGRVWPALLAAVTLPMILVAATVWGEERAHPALVRRMLTRWALVGALAALFIGLLPQLSARRETLAANRPLAAALDRGRATGVLDLSQHRLSALPPEVTTMTSLVKLDLTGCELTALPDAITNLQVLEELSLVRNAFTDLPAELRRLGKLPKLRVLRLGDNRLDVLPGEIGLLPALVELQLQHNLLTTLPPALFSLRSLEVLQLGSALDGNRLTTIPDRVAELAQLRTLDLRNNPLSPDALAEIRRLLPRTAVLSSP